MVAFENHFAVIQIFSFRCPLRRVFIHAIDPVRTSRYPILYVRLRPILIERCKIAPILCAVVNCFRTFHFFWIYGISRTFFISVSLAGHTGIVGGFKLTRVLGSPSTMLSLYSLSSKAIAWIACDPDINAGPYIAANELTLLITIERAQLTAISFAYVLCVGPVFLMSSQHVKISIWFGGSTCIIC